LNIMTVSPGDVIRVTAKLLGAQGQSIQNVYYFKSSGVSGEDDATVVSDLANHLDAAYDNLAVAMHEDVVFDELDFFNETQGVPMATVDWPTQTVGDVAGYQPLPAQCAALVSFRTGEAHGNGRKFLGGMTEGSNDGTGYLASGVRTQMALYAVDLLGALVSGGLSFQVGHVREATGQFLPWLAGIINAYWRTQRRRVIGVGS
jgi:hypothetical protein